MAQQVKKWNKSRLLLQLPVYHSAYLDFHFCSYLCKRRPLLHLVLWCFHLTPSGNRFCCQPFYELFLDTLNPFDPSDLVDVSRTEYFRCWLADCLSFRNILVFGQLRNIKHSFSWTFPENSRWPGGFYFYMMFMIPEVLVNFSMKNLLKMFWPRQSKSINSIN